MTPLQGIEYEEDNGRVFGLLKSWTINGHAWTRMRAFNSVRNGRGAWLALVNHFEGDAQRDRVKDHAYALIAAAKYYGEKKRFTFETYITIHQDAYADLEQYGELISEEKRVRDLLTNIKDNSPATNAAKGPYLQPQHYVIASPMLLRIYLPHCNSVKPYRMAAIYQPLKPKVVVQAVVAMVEVDELEVKVVAEEGIYFWAVTALINGRNYHLQI